MCLKGLKTSGRQCNIVELSLFIGHQYLQQHFPKGFRLFKKHIFITFKLNYRFDTYEKN